MSWIKTLAEVSKGEVTVPLYDAEGYSQLKRAQEKGEMASVTPLVSIVVNYPGSYSKYLETSVTSLVSSINHSNFSPISSHCAGL